jgi:hypothetical protein
MDRDGHICLVVWRGPGIGSKVQCPFVLLGPIPGKLIDQSLTTGIKVTYLQHFRDTLSYPYEYFLYVPGNRIRGRDFIIGTAGLHQLLVTTVLDNCKWPLALGHPTHYLSPAMLVEIDESQKVSNSHLASLDVC